MAETQNTQNQYLTKDGSKLEPERLLDAASICTSGAELSSDLWRDMASAKKKSSDWTELKFEQNPVIRKCLDKLSESTTFKGILDGLKAASETIPAPRRKYEWTVALDLTTDFDNDKEGKFYRLEDLKKFAETTKGKDVAIVVQAAFKEPPLDYLPQMYRLERYVIKDGSIKQVSTNFSYGYGSDLQDLVEYASHELPSKKMALIMDSHGLGNEGLLGDTGTVSMEEFVRRIRAGLEGSSRNKLDLIDFDSCYMAQNGVLKMVKEITDHVVASAELEPSKGISLTPIFKSLLDKPQQDGKDLGRTIVNSAREQCAITDAANKPPLIRTVAHLELSKYDEFAESLNKFGDLLAESLKDPSNKAAITKTVTDNRRYHFNEEDDIYQADLTDFAKRIMREVNDGRISDEKRELKSAAQDVLTKQSNLVDAFYGNKTYEETGGLSVFLPTWYHLHPEWEARQTNGAGRLVNLTEPYRFKSTNADEKSRKEFVTEAVQKAASLIPFGIMPGGPLGAPIVLTDPKFSAIGKSIKEFKEAKDDAGRLAAFNHLHSASEAVSELFPLKQIQENKLAAIKERTDTEFKKQLVPADGRGWARFQRALLPQK